MSLVASFLLEHVFKRAATAAVDEGGQRLTAVVRQLTKFH